MPWLGTCYCNTATLHCSATASAGELVQKNLWEQFKPLVLAVDPSAESARDLAARTASVNKAYAKLQCETMAGMIVACDYQAQDTHPVPAGKYTRQMYEPAMEQRSGQVRWPVLAAEGLVRLAQRCKALRF